MTVVFIWNMKEKKGSFWKLSLLGYLSPWSQGRAERGAGKRKITEVSPSPSPLLVFLRLRQFLIIIVIGG